MWGCKKHDKSGLSGECPQCKNDKINADNRSCQVDTFVNPLVELKKISTTEWARIWCDLNSYKFSKELEHIKPKEWENMGREMLDFLRPLMEHIEYIIGMKACNRYWNKDNMTDEEHEEFYSNNFEAG